MPVPLKYLIVDGGVDFLVFDTYDDTQSAPITTPRTLEAGYVTVVGESRIAIDGGLLVGVEDNLGESGVAYSNVSGAGITLADGMLFGFNRKSASASTIGGGFRSTTAQTGSYFSFNLGTNYGVTLYNGAFFNFGAPEFAGEVVVGYWFDNSLIYVFNYDYTDPAPRWELKMVLPAIVGAYYASVQLCRNLASGTTEFKALAAREGLTGIIGGVSCGVTAGSTASAPNKDFIAHMVITTIPASGTFEFRFRIQDANNYWSVKIDAGGNVSLVETVGGTPTTQASDTGVVANGEHLVISANDEQIDVWANETRISYASAANFKTATAVELEALGTSGVVADILLHRFYVVGGVLDALESVRFA